MSSGIVKAAQDLLREVNAHLDGRDDEDMSADADALTDSIHGTGEVDPVLAQALVEEVDAYLDYGTDKDMERAVEALRALLPPPAPVPGR